MVGNIEIHPCILFSLKFIRVDIIFGECPGSTRTYFELPVHLKLYPNFLSIPLTRCLRTFQGAPGCKNTEGTKHS